MNGTCALTQGPRSLPSTGLGAVRALTAATALALQIAALYAVFATFGWPVALCLYTLGALATALQYRVARRITC